MARLSKLFSLLLALLLWVTSPATAERLRHSVEKRPSTNSLRCLSCADLPGGGHCRARERVLDVAGRLFREKGFDGIGIDDLMKGSRADARRFYANFKSKEELMAKSCERTLAELVENWTKVTSKAKREPLRAIVAGYLSISHRDDPANGCVVAALGAGVARKSRGSPRCH